MLSSLPQYGPELAGRFRNSWSGLGRRAVPEARLLARREAPARPADRPEGQASPGLVDPEDCLWRG